MPEELKEHPWLLLPLLYGLWAVFGAFLDSARNRRMERFLRAQGVPAVATVVSAREKGGHAEGAPTLILTMQVSQQGQPERELKAEKLIPVLGAALFQPGAKMRLLVHPIDPDQFLFDEPWNPPPEHS